MAAISQTNVNSNLRPSRINNNSSAKRTGITAGNTNMLLGQLLGRTVHLENKLRNMMKEKYQLETQVALPAIKHFNALLAVSDCSLESSIAPRPITLTSTSHPPSDFGPQAGSAATPIDLSVATPVISTGQQGQLLNNFGVVLQDLAAIGFRNNFGDIAKTLFYMGETVHSANKLMVQDQKLSFVEAHRKIIQLKRKHLTITTTEAYGDPDNKKKSDRSSCEEAWPNTLNGDEETDDHDHTAAAKALNSLASFTSSSKKMKMSLLSSRSSSKVDSKSEVRRPPKESKRLERLERFTPRSKSVTIDENQNQTSIIGSEVKHHPNKNKNVPGKSALTLAGSRGRQSTKIVNPVITCQLLVSNSAETAEYENGYLIYQFESDLFHDVDDDLDNNTSNNNNNNDHSNNDDNKADHRNNAYSKNMRMIMMPLMSKLDTKGAEKAQQIIPHSEAWYSLAIEMKMSSASVSNRKGDDDNGIHIQVETPTKTKQRPIVKIPKHLVQSRTWVPKYQTSLVSIFNKSTDKEDEDSEEDDDNDEDSDPATETEMDEGESDDSDGESEEDQERKKNDPDYKSEKKKSGSLIVVPICDQDQDDDDDREQEVQVIPAPHKVKERSKEKKEKKGKKGRKTFHSDVAGSIGSSESSPSSSLSSSSSSSSSPFEGIELDSKYVILLVGQNLKKEHVYYKAIIDFADIADRTSIKFNASFLTFGSQINQLQEYLSPEFWVLRQALLPLSEESMEIDRQKADKFYDQFTLKNSKVVKPYLNAMVPYFDTRILHWSKEFVAHVVSKNGALKMSKEGKKKAATKIPTDHKIEMKAFIEFLHTVMIPSIHAL